MPCCPGPCHPVALHLHSLCNRCTVANNLALAVNNHLRIAFQVQRSCKWTGSAVRTQNPSTHPHNGHSFAATGHQLLLLPPSSPPSSSLVLVLGAGNDQQVHRCIMEQPGTASAALARPADPQGRGEELLYHQPRHATENTARLPTQTAPVRCSHLLTAPCCLKTGSRR
jgi:hypothetical protein